jgi:5-methyltetrahydrofolate--homocysteine methyltransferase
MDLSTFIMTQDKILLDGAMGTQLALRGLSMGGHTNLTNPDAVLDIHQQYSQCGCHILITNTLIMNRIYIETMLDLREALCALRACKEISDLPVIVSLAFSWLKNRGRTIMGNSARDCAMALTESGAQAVGANCGDINLSQMAEIVSGLCSATRLPVLAQPNAGKPRLIDNRTEFDMSPADFSKGIFECIRAGANLVGGCCGTSPEHIRAVAQPLI